MSDCRGCGGTCCTGQGSDPCTCSPRETGTPLKAGGQALVAALEARGIKVSPDGVGFGSKCPMHGDQQVTLAIRQLEGGLLVYCRGGCLVDAVLADLGLSPASLLAQ